MTSAIDYLALADRFARLYTGAVLDVLDELGLREQALPHGLLPLAPGHLLLGPAFAIEGRPHPGMDREGSMVAILEMLGAIPRGHVAVYQTHDDTCAHLGELSVTALKARGCAGAVIDGGCRDVGHVLRERFTVYCRYTTPLDAVGRWEMLRYGHEVFIGGVRISTHDYVIGDRDGVVVVPAELCEEVVARAELIASTENAVRDAVRQGALPLDAYRQFGRF